MFTHNEIKTIPNNTGPNISDGLNFVMCECSLRLIHTKCPVTITVMMGKMGMQPILSVTVPIKKIKGAARQRYCDGDGIA